MNDLSKLDQYYIKIKGNRWHYYFSIFCRLALAIGFIASGLVKIVGERFANGLSPLHPMGAYLEALHHTGYYYTFIGIAQVLAALLLLIPRTVILGAILYLPIITNICILSFAVRFDGSFITAPLMLLANLYILAWNYDRIKYILPFKTVPNFGIIEKPKNYNHKFPFRFFAVVIAIFILIVGFFLFGHEVMPRNSLLECKKQFLSSDIEDVGCGFCECVHQKGRPLDECLQEFKSKKNDK